MDGEEPPCNALAWQIGAVWLSCTSSIVRGCRTIGPTAICTASDSSANGKPNSVV